MLTSLLSENMMMWINKSVESELYASNLYKSLANQLQRSGYFGAQKFYLKESSEELEHYQILVDFVNDMGGCVSLPKIDAVTDVAMSIGMALQISYETEIDLLNQYNQFYKKAEDDNCAVGQFLLQFIEIQRKSVGLYGDLLARYARCQENAGAILDFDKYMSKQ